MKFFPTKFKNYRNTKYRKQIPPLPLPPESVMEFSSVDIKMIKICSTKIGSWVESRCTDFIVLKCQFDLSFYSVHHCSLLTQSHVTLSTIDDHSLDHQSCQSIIQVFTVRRASVVPAARLLFGAWTFYFILLSVAHFGVFHTSVKT